MTFYIKQNDTLPAISAQLVDADGTVPDITGATVKFIMRLTSGGAAKVDASATIVTAATANVKYGWIGADTDTVGDYEGEFEVTLATGGIQTYPNSKYIPIKVMDDIA